MVRLFRGHYLLLGRHSSTAVAKLLLEMGREAGGRPGPLVCLPASGSLHLLAHTGLPRTGVATLALLSSAPAHGRRRLDCEMLVCGTTSRELAGRHPHLPPTAGKSLERIQD